LANAWAAIFDYTGDEAHFTSLSFSLSLSLSLFALFRENGRTKNTQIYCDSQSSLKKTTKKTTKNVICDKYKTQENIKKKTFYFVESGFSSKMSRVRKWGGSISNSLINASYKAQI
jgi:hypothetical protein